VNADGIAEVVMAVALGIVVIIAAWRNVK